MLFIVSLAFSAMADEPRMPHEVFGTITNADSSSPDASVITFTAYITARPTEILTQTSTGCVVTSSGGLTQYDIDVSRFTTQWQPGDELTIVMNNTGNGQAKTVPVSLVSGDQPQQDIQLVEATVVVTFDARGGATPVPPSKNVAYGAPYGDLAVTTRADYTFAGWWTGTGGTGTEVTPTTTVTNNAAHTLYANWVAIQNVTLSVTSSGASGVAITATPTSYRGTTPYEKSVLAGTAVSLTAPPVDGKTFTGWTGTYSKTENPLTFTMTGNAAVRANYATQQVTVSLTANPANGGSFSGGTTKNYGSSFTLTASPSSGYKFVNWTENGQPLSSANPYTLPNVTANRALVANFTPVETVLISVSASPADAGTAAVTGGGNVEKGKLATVTAKANSGKKFSNWTENGVEVPGARASYSFTATANRTLVANFTEAAPDPVTSEPAVSTAFTGTVTVKANWVNFSGLDADDVNCNDWVAFPVTYNAYLVLCYGEILCPVCPFEITDAWLWLVDKKGKQVFAASLEDGGLMDVEGYCFGNGNVGVNFTAFLPYADLEGLTGTTYTTSFPMSFALAGTRQKASTKGASNIVALEGGAALFAVSSPKDGDPLAELECEDASEAAFVTASFKKSGTKVKADPYCPECATSCESVYAAQLAVVAKAAKKYFWWDILGEGVVEPALK
ncbi:MAG: InlB B-repeat-containing protein [Lentisphaeria bacterium]